MQEQRNDQTQTSLADILGVDKEKRLAIIGAPDEYLEHIGLAADEVTLEGVGPNELDLVQFFATTKSVLNVFLPDLSQRLAKDGVFWITWPRNTGEIITDLDENSVIAAGRRCDMIDTKAISIDETWSALKFVRRQPML